MTTKPFVLYVDDEPINLKLFQINFSRKYNIITAENGMEGLEKLAEYEDINIVVSDMKMPMMNGIEFIKLAKEKHPKVNYFILTGFEINDDIQQALDSGLILSYFKKPFDIHLIDRSISEVL